MPLRRAAPARECPVFAPLGAVSLPLLLLVLRLVAGRARTETPVAIIGEAAVAAAPTRIGRLVAGRAGTLAAVAVVGHACVDGRGRRHRHVQSGNRDACEQGQSNRSGSKGLQHFMPPVGVYVLEFGSSPFDREVRLTRAL